MNWKPIVFLGVPMAMYLAQAVTDYLQQGRYGMALCLAAYSLANVGLILDAYGV